MERPGTIESLSLTFKKTGSSVILSFPAALERMYLSRVYRESMIPVGQPSEGRCRKK